MPKEKLKRSERGGATMKKTIQDELYLLISHRFSHFTQHFITQELWIFFSQGNLKQDIA